MHKRIDQTPPTIMPHAKALDAVQRLRQNQKDGLEDDKWTYRVVEVSDTQSRIDVFDEDGEKVGSF